MSASEVPAEAGGRRATWFELFCDLVFVAAVGQVTHRISGHPGIGSVAAAAALFVPLWWTWVLYMFRNNRADRDNTAHRLLTIVGLAAVTGMAVFVGDVGHGQGPDIGFVVSYLCARAGVAALYAWKRRRVPALAPLLRSFLIGSTVSALFWLGGVLLLHGPFRYAAWGVAMAVELALPLVAGRHVARASHDAEHLRERHPAGQSRGTGLRRAADARVRLRGPADPAGPGGDRWRGGSRDGERRRPPRRRRLATT